MHSSSPRILQCILVLLAISSLMASLSSAEQSTYFTEDWESGMGLWSASNGIWQVGAPNGGCSTFQGTNVVATNLSGNYPQYTNTRLQSPVISLPAEPADGQLWLCFWQWFSYYPENDLARVEISVDGGGWETISDTFYHTGGCWSPYHADLSPYAGQTVQIGFHMIDAVDSSPQESWGWYVDDISIIDGKFSCLMPETFDIDCHGPQYGGWYATRGVWQIGPGTHGVEGALSGHFCAGTRLDGNYPRYANSRLVSPILEIPAEPFGGEVWLSFMHWYQFYPEGDYGRVEVLVDGSWTSISSDFKEYSGPWTECILDLTPYLGQSIRVGFHIADAVDSSPAEQYGWFIDDFAVVEGPTIFNNPDSFEGGSRGWAPNNGVWEVGTPTSGPSAARTGEHCWGTSLAGNYPRYASSELLTSWVQMPDVATEPIHFKFFEWHNFYPEGDYGEVRIHTADGASADLSAHFTGSGDWSQWVSDDLSATYAGQRVRFGFYIGDAVDSSPQQTQGWYIDDVELTGMPQSTPATWPQVGQNFPTVSYTPEAPLLEWFFLPFDPEYVVVYASRIPDFQPNLGHRIALLDNDPTTYLDEARPGWGYFYRIALIDDLWHESPPGPTDGPYVGVPEDRGDSPRLLAALEANVPNPFNPSTTMHFKLNRDTTVSLEVFDVAGRLVATILENEPMASGVHEVKFAPRELPSGLYLCRLAVGDEVHTRKMLLAK